MSRYMEEAYTLYVDGHSHITITMVGVLTQSINLQPPIPWNSGIDSALWQISDKVNSVFASFSIRRDFDCTYYFPVTYRQSRSTFHLFGL